jgi:hypothetical protein
MNQSNVSKYRPNLNYEQLVLIKNLLHNAVKEERINARGNGISKDLAACYKMFSRLIDNAELGMSVAYKVQEVVSLEDKLELGSTELTSSNSLTESQTLNLLTEEERKEELDKYQAQLMQELMNLNSKP